MRRIVVGILLAVGFSISMVGCSEKTKVQETKTTQTPQGKTEVKTTTEETKSGENPPNP